MSNSLKLDEFESREIEAVIKVALVKDNIDVIRTQLNRSGFADYSWLDFEREVTHLERKQCNEILQNIDGVGDQLRRERAKCPRLRLLVEGVAEPDANGTALYKVRPNGQGFIKSRRSGIPYSRYEGFLVGLEREGIEVYKSTSWMASAEIILRLFKSDQREAHSSINRHTVPHVEQFVLDPQVRALMGLCAGLDDGVSKNEKIRMGPQTAEALIAMFKDVWHVIINDPEYVAMMVEGVGKQRMERLANRIGKESIE